MHELFNANDQRKLRVCLLNISRFTWPVIVRLLYKARLDNDLIGELERVSVSEMSLFLF